MSLPLIFTMMVAYLTADIESVKMLFQDPNKFVSEAPFNFLMVSLIVFSFGPGAFSMDALIKRYVQKK
jgi:putative oxidoreductase